MIKYKYVLFDLDGTLIDTKEGIISAVVQTMNRFGQEVPQRSVLESFIGPPMQDSIKSLYQLDDETAMKMANTFRDLYRTDKYLYNSEPYEGIFLLLDTLKKQGAVVGVATYKRNDYATKLLVEKGFDKYTSYMYGSDFEGKLTKADIIRQCLNNMGCRDNADAVYIGDGESDGKNANAVGIDFIAVTYGYGFKNDNETLVYNPVGIAHDCADLEKFLLA